MLKQFILDRAKLETLLSIMKERNVSLLVNTIYEDDLLIVEDENQIFCTSIAIN